MASFLELPDELLDQILSYLSEDKRLLSKLSIQCRHLYSIVRPHLLLHVEFWIVPESPKRRCFIHEMDSNPQLMRIMRAIYFPWVRDTHKYILEKLGNRQQLKIEAECVWQSFKPVLMDGNLLSKATSIDRSVTMSRFARYIFLESMEDLCVFFIQNSQFPTLPLGCKPKTSPVQILKLGRDSQVHLHLSSAQLKEILSWPKELRILRCGISGESHCYGKYNLSKIETPLSPANIGQALSAVKYSLVDLNLMKGGYMWCNRDESRMDLSMMETLRNITAPSICFFKSDCTDAERRGLFKLLPFSLERLKIIFDWNDGNGCLQHPGSSQEDEREERSRDYTWLMELAENKSQLFPRLGIVEFSDSISYQEGCPELPRLDELCLETWKPPATIVKVFEGSQIKLSAQVMGRAPSGYRRFGGMCMPQYI